MGFRRLLWFALGDVRAIWSRFSLAETPEERIRMLDTGHERGSTK